MTKKVRVRTLVIAAVALSLLLLVGAYSVNAATTTTTQQYPPIVEKLIKKFNLDRSEVGKAFEEFHQERQAEHKALFEERLDQAVKDGTITQAQKDAILKKMDEMKTKIEDINNQKLTVEERQAAMQKLHTEIRAWAKENGLDKKLHLFGGFMGGRGGFKGGHGGFMGGPGGPGFGGRGGFMHGPGGPGGFMGGPARFAPGSGASGGTTGI